MTLTAVDVRILTYLRSKVTPRSIYDIMKGTSYTVGNKTIELSYETVKEHCWKLFNDYHVIHRYTNKNPKKRPKVKYAYDLKKTQVILNLIQAQQQQNQT